MAAIQLEQTWDSFEEGGGIKALKKYTGLGGTAKYYNDLRKYLQGNESNPDFDALLVAKEQLHIFADQYMRAFPGSTGAARMQSVYDNTDPSSFIMPPGALEAKIRGKWATLKPELGTIKNVLHGKNPLRGDNEMGAHNETINALDENTRKINNKKTLKNQQEAARKAIPRNNEPKKEEPIKISHIWKDGKWVSKK